jgi:hypothetical protein
MGSLEKEGDAARVGHLRTCGMRQREDGPLSDFRIRDGMSWTSNEQSWCLLEREINEKISL